MQDRGWRSGTNLEALSNDGGGASGSYSSLEDEGRGADRRDERREASSSAGSGAAPHGRPQQGEDEEML